MLRIKQDEQNQIDALKSDLIKTHRKCGGTGYLPGKIEGMVSRCSCMIIFRYLSKLIRSNISVDYWMLNFDDLLVDDKIKKSVKIYLDHINTAKHKGLGLVLHGNNGTGKTSIMCEIGKSAILEGYKVRYLTLNSYIDALFSKDKINSKNLTDYYEDADFLLVDEIDKTNGNIKNAIDEFFRRMINMKKCIICGTNMNSDLLDSALGKSVVSLLKRRSKFIQFDGNDFSEKLEEDFNNRLLEEIDYFSPSIWKIAMEYETRFIERQEN
jgi:DNA replication protein DnaC